MLDVQSLIKYLLEGVAVAIAAYYIPRKNVNLQEVGLIALTAAAVFAVLDQFAPAVSAGARNGAGFGIGYSLTGGSEDDVDVDVDVDVDEDDLDELAELEGLDELDELNDEGDAEVEAVSTGVENFSSLI